LALIYRKVKYAAPFGDQFTEKYLLTSSICIFFVLQLIAFLFRDNKVHRAS